MGPTKKPPGFDEAAEVRAEIALTPHDIALDLERERASLDESFRHDFSTSETGIVPLDHRRPIWHFYGLMLTYAAGFGYVFVGFTLHDAGFDLAKTAAVLAAGAFIYGAYAMLGAYLGARTGQTHSLLTRSVFGLGGSWIVSIMVFVTFSGWVGFNANLAAQLWNGLYGWPILGVGIALAGAMVFNNLFGFTGISAWARYVVSPVLVLWILYLVIKGFTTESSHVLGSTPKATSPIGTLAGINFVVGFIMFGTEPDTWRYGKPRFSWSFGPYAFALFIPGFALMAIGGWIMAALSPGRSYGQSMPLTTHYSLFGAFWLAWILVLITQVALNDGNYYASINAVQNIMGGWRKWRRIYSCLVALVGGCLAAWIVPDVLTNGFFKLATFAAISVPTATVIMFTDHFLLPRLLHVSRPLTTVPAWRETAILNWPGTIALLCAAGFGAYASGLLTMFGESSSTNIGLAALEAWGIGAVVYVVGVVITRFLAPNFKAAMGFAHDVRDVEVSPPAAVDIASVAAAAVMTSAAGAAGEATAVVGD